MTQERVIWGPPGTGKTTAAIELVRGWFGQMGPDEVAYLAFTRSAAKEALGRILDDQVSERQMKEQAPYFRTIHSLAYMGLRRANPDLRVLTTSDMKRFSKESGLEGRFSVHEWEDLSEVFQSLKNRGRTIFDDALTAYKLSRIEATSREDMELSRLRPSRLACSVVGYLEGDVYEVTVKKYEAFKKKEGLVDFTDMLEFALCSMEPIGGIRRVVVDEVQDLSPVTFAIVDRLAGNTAEEIWWIGDDDQCQPGDTQVALDRRGRTKRIDELKKRDEVLSFDRRGSNLVGRRITRTASRRYSGPLFSISAGGRSTRATLDHRFVFRWTKPTRFGKACVTYLMEQDGRWRVGWCQLFNVEGVLHLNIRMNGEKAHRAWILGVHKDRGKASIQESIISCRYGIPTTPFEPVCGSTHLTRRAIDEIFEGVGDCGVKAAECLWDHGRDIRYPIINKLVHKGRRRTTVMETQACNLIDEIMAVPVVREHGFEWKPIRVRKENVSNMKVFSLKVDRCETYVADGIVTHNSIYTFSGARAELFLERAKRARSQIQLRQTHRFGPDIVKYSRAIITRVGERKDKEVFGLPGAGSVIRSRGTFKPTTGDMLILHRHVQGCQQLAAEFVDAGLPFVNERGKDPLSATNRVKAWKTLDELAHGKKARWGSMQSLMEDLVPTRHVDDDGNKTRLIVHGAKVRLKDQRSEYVDLEALRDLKILTEDGVEALRQKRYSWLKYADDLAYYERVIKNGHSLDQTRVPVISTIHGSKGRQAPKVVVMSEMGRRCWDDRDSEHRLAYVAATRAQKELEVCHDRKVDWAETPYPYPNEEQVLSKGG